MDLAYETLDVFTDTRFGGNPLAVVLDADALTTEQMQAVAREFNYSETTFVCAPEGEGEARVRIFTPTYEMPFAGHPNVGTAFVLATRDHSKTAFTFEEIAGPVSIAVHRESSNIARVDIRAPEPLTVGETASIETVAACLGLATGDIETVTHVPCTASVGAEFTMVELTTRDALAKMSVTDPAVLASLGGLDSIYAYTRDAAADDADIAARMIMHVGSIVEDPATGSATGACAALLHSLTGETDLFFSQGVDMGRPSRIVTHADMDGVTIGGTCVPVMSGTLTL